MFCHYLFATGKILEKDADNLGKGNRQFNV